MANLAIPTKEDLIYQCDALEQRYEAEKPLGLMADAALSTTVGVGLGVGDGMIGDGSGALVKGIAFGASFAAIAATGGGTGPVGRAARVVFTATNGALGHVAGAAIAAKVKSDRAKKKMEEAAAAAAKAGGGEKAAA